MALESDRSIIFYRLGATDDFLWQNRYTTRNGEHLESNSNLKKKVICQNSCNGPLFTKARLRNGVKTFQYKSTHSIIVHISSMYIASNLWHIIVFYRFRPLLLLFIVLFSFSVVSCVCCTAVNYCYVIESRVATEESTGNHDCDSSNSFLTMCSRGTSHSVADYGLFYLYYLHCTLRHKSITFLFLLALLYFFFFYFYFYRFLTVYISIYKQPYEYDTRASSEQQQNNVKWRDSMGESENRETIAQRSLEWHFFSFFSSHSSNLSPSNFILNLF